MFESVNGIHEYCIRNEQTFMSNITPEVLAQFFYVSCKKHSCHVTKPSSSGFGCMFVFVVCVKLYLALVKEFLKNKFQVHV
jgi:hypothetical protein